MFLIAKNEGTGELHAKPCTRLPETADVRAWLSVLWPCAKVYSPTVRPTDDAVYIVRVYTAGRAGGGDRQSAVHEWALGPRDKAVPA